MSWNGTPLVSTYIDSLQLNAVVPASLRSVNGNIVVVNPDGKTSGSTTVVVTPKVSINSGGIVPNDSAVPVIQPGSWISIYGLGLASGNYVWNADFPVSLNGTSVTIDNKPAYLWYVSPTQINLQAPDDPTTGAVTVTVTSPAGTATSTVTLAPYGPSFSLLGDGKHVAGQIALVGGGYDLVGPAGLFPFSTRPVNPGEVLILYGAGFGPTTPVVPAGQLFSGAARTTTPVTITIGGVPANVAFSGITEAGLYQFNLTVPAGTGTGDQLLQATVNGISTPSGPVVTIGAQQGKAIGWKALQPPRPQSLPPGYSGGV